MKYSGEFKTIDTQEKAYFLGQSGDKIRLKCRDCYRSFSVPMPTSEVTQNE